MFEYKVIKVANPSEAEGIMNNMAKDGWRVVSTTYWTKWGTYLVITFEREKSNFLL